MSADTKYNGWTNRETWLVALWWLDHIQETQYGIEWSADSIRDWIEESEDSEYGVLDRASLFSDFLGQCLRCVNWHEIAEHANED